MSDEYYLEEYEDWEPHSAVDELVERTIASPVLTSYTAALDWLSDFDSEDFEDSEDEYDNLSALKGTKAKTSEQADGKSNTARPSNRSSDVKSRRSKVRQTVIWKPWRERLPSPEVPIWKDGQHQKIALLTDWRQRSHVSNELATPAKANKVKGKPGRKVAATKPAIGKEIPSDEDQELKDEAEAEAEAEVSELPPTVLHKGELPVPAKKPPQHGYMNGTTSSRARQALPEASNDEEAVVTQSKKRKASEPPDTNGSVRHEFKPKRGRPSKKEKSSGEVDGVANEAATKVTGEEKEQVPKKGTQGRAKGSTQASKASSTTVTVASTRTTRNKKR